MAWNRWPIKSTDGIAEQTKEKMPLYTNGAFYVQYGASTAFVAATAASCLTGGTIYTFNAPAPFAQPWANSTLTLQPGALSLGTTLRGDFYGTIGNVDGAETMIFTTRLGTTVVATSGTITLAAITGSSPLHVWFNITVTAYSATVGALQGMLGFEYSAATAGGVLLPIIGAETATATFDTTIARAIDLFAVWGAANASNTLTINRGYIELIG
jgi:hypothetical protein